jgi:hypothetical protein
VPGVLAAATGSDWSSGGALFTFYFPVGLFIVVAVSLYVNFTRPHAVPANRRLAAAGTLAVTEAAAGRQGKDTVRQADSPTGGTAPEQEPAAAADDDHHETPSAGT